MENETLKQRVLEASHLVWGRLGGWGTLENGWEFNGLSTERGQRHCYEKQGVAVEFQETTPADWYCWKAAANILKLTSNP